MSTSNLVHCVIYIRNTGRQSLVIYIRPPMTPLKISLASLSQVQYIIFCHPGYNNTHNVLLKLFAPNASSSSSSSASSGIGLHASYALTACGIIARNRWDGWLSEHRHYHRGRDNPAWITLCATDQDKMLDKHSYYFHLPYNNNDNNIRLLYPIIPMFQE